MYGCVRSSSDWLEERKLSRFGLFISSDFTNHQRLYLLLGVLTRLVITADQKQHVTRRLKLTEFINPLRRPRRGDGGGGDVSVQSDTADVCCCYCCGGADTHRQSAVIAVA